MKSILPLLFCFELAMSAVGIKPDGNLDMEAMQATYKEGELDAVKTALEGFLKDKGNSTKSEERIFAYKYLGVIHAADPGGRTRAESYFNRLLELSPHIELTGMFVSKNIQAIFDEAKKDFERNKEYGRRYDDLGRPIAGATDSAAAGPKGKTTEVRPKTKSKGKTWIWWTAGIGAAAAAGTVVYLATSGEENPARHFSGGFR